jgi:hypothetical protein
MPSHAVSALEEAKVKRLLSYLIIAVLLTVPHGAVTVYYGTAIWAAWASDLPVRELLFYFAALEAMSLVNVWVQAGSVLHAFSGSQSAIPSSTRCPLERGREDKAMFDSINDLGAKLAATGYFIDPVMTQVVFLAAKLQKPLLLEGPAGSGNNGTCCRSKVAKTNSPRRSLTARSPSTTCSA